VATTGQHFEASEFRATESLTIPSKLQIAFLLLTSSVNLPEVPGHFVYAHPQTAGEPLADMSLDVTHGLDGLIHTLVGHFAAD
jgi:hypothetical protein